MLDLDVGFVDSPMNIVQKLSNSKKDIFVQVRAPLPVSCARSLSNINSNCLFLVCLL